jgi:hypothetical protein
MAAAVRDEMRGNWRGNWRFRGGNALTASLVVRPPRSGVVFPTGFRAAQPLSGMRCICRQAFDAVQALARGWGVETALIVDILRKGYRIDEVPTGFHHRVTGRSFGAQAHRARQFRDVAIALALRYMRGLLRPGNRRPSSLSQTLLRLAGNAEALWRLRVEYLPPLNWQTQVTGTPWRSRAPRRRTSGRAGR